MPERSFSVRLTARVDAYTAAMNQAKAATQGFSKDTEANLKKVGGQMQNVGRWSTTHVSLPLAGLGAVAGKMAYDFDLAFSRMMSLAGVTAGEIDGLKESVQDLAHETARSPQELADALYFLRSSGLDGAEAMDALEMSAKASAAGLGDTAVIADAVSSAMNAYAMSGLSAAEATDVLVATARAGKAEPEQLAGALGRVLPVASELGVTFDDVGGAIASLSLTGNDANVSATLLTNVLTKLLKPSQQSAEALAAVGMSTGSIRQSIADNGLLGTLEELRSKLGDAGFVKFLEDAQAVTGALSLTGENIEGVRDVFGQLDAAAGSTGEAFNKISQTDGFKLQQGLTDLKNAGVDMGDVLVPVAANVASGVGSLASAVGELPGPARTGVVALGGLAVAAGPVIWAAGTIVKNFRDVSGAVQYVSGRLHTAEGDLTRTGRAAKAASIAFGALAAIEIADLFVNTTGQAAANVERRLQALTIAIGDLQSGADSGTSAMEAFRDSVAAEGNHGFTLNPFTNAKQVIEDVGKEVKIVGGDVSRNIEEIDRAFQSVLDQDPTQAQVLLDTWRAEAEALDHNSGQYKDNIALIDGYQERIDLTVGSQEALTRSMDGTTAAASAGGSAVEDYGAAAQRTADATHAASEAAKEHVDALQEEIDALEQGRDALQGMLDARLGYADASVGYDRAQDRMLETLRDVPAAVKEAKGDQLALNDVYRDAADAVAAAADADVEKWRTSLEGAGATLAEADALDIRNRALLNAIPAWQGDRDALIERIALVNGIDDEKATTIVTVFDEFGADAAMVALNEISETREVAVQVDETNSTIDGKMQDLESAEYTAEVLVDADTHWAEQAIAAVENGNYTATVKVQPQYGVPGGLPGPPSPGYGQPGGLPGPPSPTGHATGTYATGPQVGLFGEDGAEWIAPLTKPGLMRAWLTDPRIRGPVTNALGIPGFADGGIIGRVLQAGGGSTSGPVTSESSRMANMYEFGAISDADYRAYLASQLDGLDEFSDEWAAVKREIRGLDEEELQRQEDKAKAAKEQADAVIAEEDRKMAALYETGVISNQQYEAYLQTRLGDYETYSADWMEKWRELSGVQEEAERAAEERREQEAEAALRRLEVLYTRAENRHRLSVAESELADAWDDVESARGDVASAEDDDARMRAERQVADALNRVADEAWEGAKARATVNGFAEGTREWAQFMRSEVTGYMGAHPELAGRLGQWLESVPNFADGAWMPATSGGRIGRLGRFAEAGQDEWILPDSKLRGALVSAAQLGVGGGGGMSEGLLRQIVDRLDRLEGGVNFNAPISVGTRDDLSALRSEADRMLWKVRTP